jgi:hypothetical protein
MNMRSLFAHAKNMSQGKKRKEPNERQTIIGSPVADWLCHSVWYRRRHP